MNKSVLFAALLLFVLAGCASSGGDKMAQEETMGPMTIDAPSAEIAIAAADAAIKKAASVDGEWRDSGKFLKSAKKAMDAGDYETAINMANKARAEGEMGYAQAMGQKNAGPWSF